MKLENPDEIYQWDLEMLYNAVKAIEEELDTQERATLKKCKYGFKVKVPIYYITQEWYELYAPRKMMSVQGYGKFPMDEFMTEIENREQELRKIILDHDGEEDPTESR